MGLKERDDFTWTYDDQPHTDRRKAISSKYPEIKSLFGTDPHFRHLVLACVATQTVMCYFLQDASWPLIVFLAYTFGGSINHALTLAIHDLCHNTAYGNSKPYKNRLFTLVANLPLGIPSGITFKKYHIDHHRYLGGITSDKVLLDTDTPLPWEAKFFKGSFLKTIWLILNPGFYGLRPVFTSPKPITKYEVYNIISALSYDGFILYAFGLKSLAYLLIGTILALGLHPMSGHFIAEHYNFIKNVETYSYYGPINMIAFNVGYHLEHHDFPFIASSRLPLVQKMAPEWYADLPYIPSYLSVLWSFITDKQVGPFARLHRVYDQADGQIVGTRGQEYLTKYLDGTKGYYSEKPDRSFKPIGINKTTIKSFKGITEEDRYIAKCIAFPSYFQN